MPPNNRNLHELLNVICRICAKEEANCISIFGPEGERQNLIKKIRICLPVDIRQNDTFPKNICLTCLTQLDASWDLYMLCKESQPKIETKFSSLKRQKNLEQSLGNTSVEEKLRNLTESYPVSYGDSAVICLAPETTPRPAPSTVTREHQAIPQTVATDPAMAPIAYITTAPAPPAVPAPQPPANEEVYPQSLIQVPQNPASESPIVYRNRSVPVPPPTTTGQTPRRRPQVPKPMATPTNPQRPAPNPLKRQNGETPTDGPLAKKPCRYCNKWFTDDIIDHHISLHLRQTFRTCLDCNKNFRSEVALERHRCGVNETIDLDPDDEEPIVL